MPSPLSTLRRLWPLALLAVAAPSAHAESAGEGAAYVVLGAGGTPQARLVVAADACPSITIDGRARPMHVRARAATLPLRPTASTPETSKPSVFPLLTCEAAVPRGARRAAVQGRPLPLPPRRIDRIVVIGDTGCRIKASDAAFQACNDPARYPFAAVAARAAAWKPDLVLHVGDYLYRENPCPADQPGCAGSPWGYGWDAWRADFFAPAAPLLAAAPWVVVRGNHENCARAGQGWRRLLAPGPLRPADDCVDPARDSAGDYTAPYVVPLGGGAQVVVTDLAIAGAKPTLPDDPRYAQFEHAYARLDALSRRARFTFAADHKPILGLAATADKHGGVKLHGGTPGIASVFAAGGRPLLPPKVDVLLAGHVHVWEQVSFSSDHPSQFIAGFSGTQEDTVPLPETPPADAAPAPGAVIEHFSSWVDGFGYMTLERAGERRWRVTVWDVAGRPVNHCSIVGRRSSCEVRQPRSQPPGG